MAFELPTVEDFFARYPEFADEDQEYIELLLEEALLFVGPSWIEDHRKTAILALMAHTLYVERQAAEALNTGGVSELTGGITSGPITRQTVGPLSVMYKGYSRSGADTSGAGAGSPSTAGFDATVYGQQYLTLRRISFPAVLVL